MGAASTALLGALFAVAAFLRDCLGVLPQMALLSPPQALKRLALVLVASLVMVVVVTNIDAAWLHLYVLSARQVA